MQPMFGTPLASKNDNDVTLIKYNQDLKDIKGIIKIQALA